MKGLKAMEANAGNGASDMAHQCRVFLLEARARELLDVARRKSKRKRVPAAQQCVRGVVVIRDQSHSADPKP